MRQALAGLPPRSSLGSAGSRTRTDSADTINIAIDGAGDPHQVVKLVEQNMEARSKHRMADTEIMTA